MKAIFYGMVVIGIALVLTAIVLYVAMLAGQKYEQSTRPRTEPTICFATDGYPASCTHQWQTHYTSPR